MPRKASRDSGSRTGLNPGRCRRPLDSVGPGEGVSAAGPAELAQPAAVGDEVDLPGPGVVHRGGEGVVQCGESGKGIASLEQCVEERRAGSGLGVGNAKALVANPAFAIHPDGEVGGAEDLCLVRVGGEAGPPHPGEGKAGAGLVLFVVLECVPHLEQGGVGLLIAPAGGRDESDYSRHGVCGGSFKRDGAGELSGAHWPRTPS